MKTTKNFAIAILLVLMSSATFAQLRVDPNGRIGMGTNYPNSGYKCHIKGNLLLTTYPEIPPPNTVPVEFQFKVGNGWPGAEFGTNVDKVAVWSPVVGYNKLYAQAFYTQSDSTLKTNITPLKSGLEIILQLKSYSYQLKEDIQKGRTIQRKNYGFLAQEVEDILPEITDSVKGVKLVDYTQIIPLLVEAIKEQQQNIQHLDSANTTLTARMDSMENNCCNQPTFNTTGNNEGGEANNPIYEKLASKGVILYDAIPNPFQNEVSIGFFIPEHIVKAEIVFHDNYGRTLKTVEVHQRGSGTLILDATELANGIYTFSIVADGQTEDARKMVRSK